MSDNRGPKVSNVSKNAYDCRKRSGCVWTHIAKNAYDCRKRFSRLFVPVIRVLNNSRTANIFRKVTTVVSVF